MHYIKAPLFFFLLLAVFLAASTFAGLT